MLEEHLRRLRERRPGDLASFRADPLLQDAVAMGVLVGVQEARHGLIAPALAASLGGAAQLRNRIAHGYASLDAERLWNELPQGVASFGEFARAVAAFLLR